MLPQGLRLRPQDVALVARQEIAAQVVRQPHVAVASTGDDLCEPEVELPPSVIYELNRYTLIGLLRRLGCTVTDLGILRNERDRVLPALRDAAATHDALLTSGGVSVGTTDLVKNAIVELGKNRVLATGGQAGQTGDFQLDRSLYWTCPAILCRWR